MESEVSAPTAAEIAWREELNDGWDDLVNGQDIGGMVAYIEANAEPDFEWAEDPAWPDARTVRGVEQLRELLQERFDSMKFSRETEGVLHTPDQMVVLDLWRGRGEGSGAEAEMRVAVVVSYRGRRMIRIEFFLDRERALRNAGLDAAAG